MTGDNWRIFLVSLAIAVGLIAALASCGGGSYDDGSGAHIYQLPDGRSVVCVDAGGVSCDWPEAR